MKKMRQLCAALLVAGLIPAAFATDKTHGERAVGAVYTMSNAVSGNAILILDRLANGGLRAAGSVATGGLGTGTGLGNQGAVVLSGDQRFLLVVNAGSDTISVLKIKRHGLRLVCSMASGGKRPLSVTEDRGFVYVLNAGTSDTPGKISGFNLDEDGSLSAIPDSTRLLSSQTASTGPAQIQFSRDGRTLIVTEKATNLILTYTIDRDGLPGDAKLNTSAGPTPFGFAVGQRRQVFVSEAAGGAANASTLSSYRLNNREHLLQVISPAVPTEQSAACWVALTPDGRLAFTTNTGSGTISAFAIAHNGKLTLIDADAGNTGAGSAPIDLALSPGGRHVFVLNSGSETITSLRIGASGGLIPVVTIEHLPDGANGLAVR